MEGLGVRPCIECGRLTDQTRCSACRSSQNIARGSSAERGYDAQWRNLREQAIATQPWCTDCGTTADLTGDHLNWPATTIDDIDVVCRPCNSRRGPRRATAR